MAVARRRDLQRLIPREKEREEGKRKDRGCQSVHRLRTHTYTHTHKAHTHIHIHTQKKDNDCLGMTSHAKRIDMAVEKLIRNEPAIVTAE